MLFDLILAAFWEPLAPEKTAQTVKLYSNIEFGPLQDRVFFEGVVSELLFSSPATSFNDFDLILVSIFGAFCHLFSIMFFSVSV